MPKLAVFQVDETLVLVIESTSLWCLWIHLTLVTLYYLYNWHKFITSTISFFSFIVSSLTIELYKDFKSVYKMSGRTNFNIFPNVAFITTLISNSYTISYNSVVKILYVIYLHFIKDLYILLALLLTLARQII